MSSARESWYSEFHDLHAVIVYLIEYANLANITCLISNGITSQIDVHGVDMPDYEYYDKELDTSTEESSDSDYDTED